MIDEAIQQPMCCKTDPICPSVMEAQKVQKGMGVRRGYSLTANRANLMSAIV